MRWTAHCWSLLCSQYSFELRCRETRFYCVTASLQDWFRLLSACCCVRLGYFEGDLEAM